MEIMDNSQQIADRMWRLSFVNCLSVIYFSLAPWVEIYYLSGHEMPILQQH